jgi:hypothetical protein
VNQPSLESPRAKLSRAHTHLTALYEQVNEFTAGPDTHAFSSEVESETVTEQGREIVQVGYIKILREPDPAWGLVFGDFIQNLRAALDHLVWQMVILCGNKPTGDNQFPICSTGTRYWCARKSGAPSVRDRTLKGISEDYRAGIDSVQPYRNVGGPKNAPLDAIAHFSNADKHRVVQAALTFALTTDDSDVDISTTVDGAYTDLERTVGPLHDGAQIVRAHHVVPDPDAKVQMHLKIPIAIGFGEGALAIESLASIYEFVRDFINTTEVLFD